MEVLSSSSSGGRRIYRYCAIARRKGLSVCANRRPAAMEAANAAVIEAVASTILDARVVDNALAQAEAEILSDRNGELRAQLEGQLADVVKASARLTTAIAQGGDLPPLVAALTTHEAKRRDVEARLAALRTPQPTLDAPAVRRQLAGYLADWRGLLRGNVAQSQAILRRLIKGRLTFTPDQAGNYTFAGVGTVRPLLAGAIRNVASPNGLAPFSAPNRAWPSWVAGAVGRAA